MEDLIAKIKRRSSKSAKTTGLKAGIHKNMELVSFKGPAERLGDYTRYLSMKFKKISEDGEPLGEFSASFTELDLHSEYLDFKVKMLLKHTYYLAVAMYGEKWRDVYDPLRDLVSSEAEAKWVNVASAQTSNKFLRALEKNVISQVTAFVEKFMEENGDKKFEMKLVYNDKGYVNLPSSEYINDQENPTFKLSLSDKEKSLIKKYK
jgi:hypothetical protein